MPKNSMLEAAQAFTRRVHATVEQINPSTIFGRRVTRELVGQRIMLTGEISNSLADILAGLHMADDYNPSCTEFHQICREEIEAAMKRISERHPSRRLAA